jgi:uncharacterized membrane protein
MSRAVIGLGVTSVVFCGAIFGFFYAWVCSTMWGLDQADPRVAIAAMQAMNVSVRNAVFFPAFFLTPVVLGLTASVMYFSAYKMPALWFAAAAVIYLIFGLLLTLAVNVPMNGALSAIAVPDDAAAARDIWLDYSRRWQFWKKVRAGASGIALAFTGLGLAKL